MYAINGKIGCTSCREVNNLGMIASRGVIISARWAECNVTSCGSTREAQLSSLRKKIHEHKNSQAHKGAINILETAKKDVLLNLNAQSEQAVNLLLEFSEQRIMWQKITNLSQTLKV